MIFSRDYDQKLVIPKWLSYERAAKTGELTWPKGTPFVVNNSTKKRFAEDYQDFATSPSAQKASDLMATAFVLGEMATAKEFAEVVKFSSHISKPAIKLAKYILGEQNEIAPSIDTRKKIASTKRFLNEFPNNPFSWMERARLHTILGQTNQAERSVRIAFNLAPADRYIARCAARFLLHTDKYEEAWNLIKKASDFQFDPWIKATEISIAELLKKKVQKIKHDLPSASAAAQVFHYSEFIESYGMLEFMHGNDHRAKKLFKLAWSHPSVNVVTHSEWVVREHFPALRDLAQDKFANSIEALTWQHYSEMHVDEALETAIQWGLEEPYARNAFSLASSLAFAKLEYSKGISLAKSGLRASSHDFGLRNNVCFGLLKMNKISEAENELLALPSAKAGTERVIGSATNGLLHFKKGDAAKGRRLYSEAFVEAEKLRNSDLAFQVAINWATTEAECHTEQANAIGEVVLKAAEKRTDTGAILARNILEKRLTELNQKQESLVFKEFLQLKDSTGLLPGTIRVLKL